MDFWPFLKLQKMEFGQKNSSWNWSIWFHEFFGLDVFKFSCPLWRIKILFTHLNKPKSIVYTSSDSFTCRHSQCDKEHGYKKYGYGKWDFVDGNVTSHFQTIITNPQINASGIEVTENLLKLLLDSAIKTSQFFIELRLLEGKKIHTDTNSFHKYVKILRGRMF